MAARSKNRSDNIHSQNSNNLSHQSRHHNSILSSGEGSGGDRRLLNVILYNQNLILHSNRDIPNSRLCVFLSICLWAHIIRFFQWTRLGIWNTLARLESPQNLVRFQIKHHYMRQQVMHFQLYGWRGTNSRRTAVVQV